MTAPQPAPTPGLLRWKGSLGQLIYALSRELDHQPPGAWRRRVLSRGACVSLCRIDNRRTIVFSRDQLPETDAGWGAWSNEVEVFLGWFGITKWEPTEDLPPGAFEGITAPLWSAYIEPLDVAKDARVSTTTHR